MNVKTILPVVSLLLLLTACGGSNANRDNIQQSTESAENQLHRMPLYDHTDTIHVGSHAIISSLHREADDSLRVVQDENGEKYADNYYLLSILKDGSTLFNHRFTKASFKGYLDEDFLKSGILDGFRYVKAENGQLFYSACVSYPESDMSAPFIVTIGPDGSYTIQKDNVMDVDEADSLGV